VAGLDHTPIDIDRPVWDGQAVCRICATHDAEAEHEWCAATNALVCRDCCHRVLAGHVALIVTEGVAALDEDVPASVEAWPYVTEPSVGSWISPSCVPSRAKRLSSSCASCR